MTSKQLDGFIDEIVEKAAAFDRVVGACVEDGMEIEALMLVKSAGAGSAGEILIRKYILLDEILKEAEEPDVKPDITSKGKSKDTVKDIVEPQILAHTPRADPQTGPHGTIGSELESWR